MARLPTQPTQAASEPPAHPVPLRSGFVALPLANGRTHLFARVHHADAPSAGEAAGGKEVFLTGFPPGTSEKGLRGALRGIWGVKGVEVRMLPSAGGAAHGLEGSLLEKELAAAEEEAGADADDGGYTPLFDSTAVPTHPSTASLSAIATLPASAPFPPAPYPATTPLTLPAAPSFLSTSRASHALARPARALVAAHADAWMRAFDARCAAGRPVGYSAERAAAEREAAAREEKKRRRKGGKAVVADKPKEGSAAEALARHAALQARLADPGYNPDAPDEGEWTTVQRGGKHGTSLLPAGVQPSVQGYGGASVKVARRARKGEEDGVRRDAGVRKIVGEGFYRFNQAEGRRKELAGLKARFEEDKRRVDRMRGVGRGGGRGGSAVGGRGRFKPY